ncbi:MAG: hypothetical protein AAGC77_03270 [Pseudomonadota bacterium]
MADGPRIEIASYAGTNRFSDTNADIGWALGFAIIRLPTIRSFNPLRPRGICDVMTPLGDWGADVTHPGGGVMVFTVLAGLVEGDSRARRDYSATGEFGCRERLPLKRIVEAFFKDVDEAVWASRSGRIIEPVVLF